VSEPATASELIGVICRTDLSPTARLAWQYLRVEQGAGRPWPSFAALAGALGISERWAREMVRELVEGGEIYERDARCRSQRYCFPRVGGEPIWSSEGSFTAA
jgi:hypothetical protein